MAQQRSGINRALMWLRKTLEITEETDAPQVLSEILRPTIDVFGWERLATPTFDTEFSPTTIVAGPITPPGVLRIVTTVSVRHTDVGVTHILWMDKLIETGEIIGLVQNPPALLNDVSMGLDRWIPVEAGARLRGRTFLALAVGNIALDFQFVDLPIGEYIAPM